MKNINNKRNILVIDDNKLGNDGITEIIYSYLKAIPKNGLNFFICDSYPSSPEIISKFEKENCSVIILPNRKTDTLKYMHSLYKTIKQNKIDVVHINGSSATMVIDMLPAKLANIKKIYVHSHNTSCENIKIDKILRPIFYRLYDQAFACGYEAGKWLFENRNFIVLKNGREIDKYRYDEIKRNKLRSINKLEDNIVIGHVGSFGVRKNQRFVLKVFRELLKIHKNSKLIFIGDGSQYENVKNLAKDLGDKVQFIKNTDKVENYYLMFDGLIFPSLYEGVSLVTIEAQINGLPCLVSDTVAHETKISNALKFESLNNGPKKWAIEIYQMINDNSQDRDRISKQAQINAIKNGFDIKESAKFLYKYYIN